MNILKLNEVKAKWLILFCVLYALVSTFILSFTQSILNFDVFITYFFTMIMQSLILIVIYKILLKGVDFIGNIFFGTSHYQHIANVLKYLLITLFLIYLVSLPFLPIFFALSRKPAF